MILPCSGRTAMDDREYWGAEPLEPGTATTGTWTPIDCKRQMDPFARIFTSEVVDTLERSARAGDQHALDRFQVLVARGPYPQDEGERWLLRRRRAQKSAWEAYLDAAEACGLFAAGDGADLIARLQGLDAVGFRSGMAECMACWYVSARRGLTVTGRGVGRPRKVPDLAVTGRGVQFTAEVKAPYETPAEGNVWWGDGAYLLEPCIDEANKQFASTAIGGHL